MDDSLRSPVFILGLHRSGTTLLYQMLAASGCFSTVTAKHVICYDELRDGAMDGAALQDSLEARFERLNVRSRGVDVVGLSPNSLEEYGFILRNLGVGRFITRRNYPVFRTICGVVRRNGIAHRPLLLKNPWDFGRGARILSLIPTARFVYLHRNPFHVLSSLYRSFRAATEKPNEYLSLLSHGYATLAGGEFPWRIAHRVGQSDSPLLIRALVRFTAGAARRYLMHDREVVAAEGMEVRYEDLCALPADTIHRILAYLGADTAGVDYASMIGPHATRIEPVIARQKEFVVQQLSTYAAAVGYDLESIAEASQGECGAARVAT